MLAGLAWPHDVTRWRVTHTPHTSEAFGALLAKGMHLFAATWASGVHAVAVALWKSGGASTTVIGALPLPVRAAIFDVFHLVYRPVKRYGSFTDLAADAATMVGGAVAPPYRSPLAAREIMHSIAAPIRAAREEDITQPSFFALVSGSSTDRGANKQELVYARTVSMGRSRTFFVGLQGFASRHGRCDPCSV